MSFNLLVFDFFTKNTFNKIANRNWMLIIQSETNIKELIPVIFKLG